MGAAPIGSFRRQLRATQAYALLAEAAEHDGGPALWPAHKRQVSIRTAIAYCAYYFFYPEHWRWEEQPLRDTSVLFRREGAFLELALLRAPTRPLPLLLRELRPLFGVYGGGWTTITHSAPPTPTSRSFVTPAWLKRGLARLRSR